MQLNSLKTTQCNYGQEMKWKSLIDRNCYSCCTQYHVYWCNCTINLAWWRYQMETFSALLTICAGNSPLTGEFPAKGQWRGALMFSLICAWMNEYVNNREAGDLRRYRAHYDVTVMEWMKHSVINGAYTIFVISIFTELIHRWCPCQITAILEMWSEIYNIIIFQTALYWNNTPFQ